MTGEIPCSVEGCGARVRGRGLCNRHYLRVKRHGHTGLTRRAKSDEERLVAMWNKVEKRASGCWVYTGGGANGYGYIQYQGASRSVHRVVYGLLRGPIPDGMQLDHLCHTTDPSCPGGTTCGHRACCNPDHLEVVTSDENKRRGGRRRAHCPNGHAYDTFIERRNGVERRCSTCINARRRANWRAKRRAA